MGTSNEVTFITAIQRSFYGSRIKKLKFDVGSLLVSKDENILRSMRNVINCCRQKITLRMYSDTVYQYLVFEYENSFHRRLEI